MSYVGYVRGSQKFKRNRERRAKLEEFGCTRIFEDNISGEDDYPGLRQALNFVQEGDTFAVASLDDAKSGTIGFLDLVDSLKLRGISFRLVADGFEKADITRGEGRFVLTLMSAFKEYEEAQNERNRDDLARASIG